MKMTPLLALHESHCTVGKPLFRIAVECHPNGKAAVVLANDLNAADGLAARPVPHGVKAFLAQIGVT